MLLRFVYILTIGRLYLVLLYYYCFYWFYNVHGDYNSDIYLKIPLIFKSQYLLIVSLLFFGQIVLFFVGSFTF